MAIVLRTIIAYRSSNKKRQEEMAEILGITRCSYANKEKGKTEFTANEIGVMAKEFNISPARFYEEL